MNRYVKKLIKTVELPFRRMEKTPGEEAQIDFGTGAPYVDANGKRRRTHVLRVVLSHSRKAYSEVVTKQTTENFIRAIENAFHAFGGVPRTLVVDNLKAAVLKADWFDRSIHCGRQCEHQVPIHHHRSDTVAAAQQLGLLHWSYKTSPTSTPKQTAFTRRILLSGRHMDTPLPITNSHHIHFRCDFIEQAAWVTSLTTNPPSLKLTRLAHASTAQRCGLYALRPCV